MREPPVAFVKVLHGDHERRSGPTARVSARAIRFVRANLAIVLVYAAVLALWQLAGPLFSVPAFLLPSPSAIAHRLLRDPSFIASHAFVTLQEVLLGFSLAALVSIPVGVVIVSSRSIERA